MRWKIMSVNVHTYFRCSLITVDVLDLLCGPAFFNLPTDMMERTETLNEAEESYVEYSTSW